MGISPPGSFDDGFSKGSDAMNLTSLSSNGSNEQEKETHNGFINGSEVNYVNDEAQAKKRGNARIHMLVSDKTVDAIGKIQDHFEASTTSEAIRRSLMLTLSLTDAVSRGEKVVIERNDGTRYVVLIG